MPKRVNTVRFVVVEDHNLGHVTIEVYTPFKWLARKVEDSLRIDVTDNTVDDLRESVAANLKLCPRAVLLVDQVAEDRRISWVEVYEDGLEVFLGANHASACSEVCDDLWRIISNISSGTWSGAAPVRKDLFGLFPRSTTDTGSHEPC